MPGASRQGDLLATGHGCAPVTVLNFPTQNTVYINGILAARQGDATVVHIIGSNPPCNPHIAFVNVGSSTVFISGSAAARIGDSTDLGAMLVGSVNVIVGG